MDLSKAKDILIIDDDETIRYSLKNALTICECFNHIHEAKNVNEGIQKIRNQDFVLILSDINMPGKDGFGILDYVKEKQNGFIENFIFISGEARTHSISRVVDNGVKNFIVKPIDLSSFYEKIYFSLNTTNPKLASLVQITLNNFKDC